MTSQGFNCSALFVFTQTLLDIRKHRQPTHLAVTFDGAVTMQRHREFPAHKAAERDTINALIQGTATNGNRGGDALKTKKRDDYGCIC